MYEFEEPVLKSLFSLFGMPVYPYALFVTLGACLALWLGLSRSRKTGLERGVVLTFALLAIPLGVICGRAVFCMCRIVDVMDFGFGYIFRIDYGGFSLIGVTLGMALAAWITRVIHRVSFLDVCDTVTPALLLVLAFARFAEGATMNGTGPEITVPALQFAPLARQGLYGEYTYAVHMGEALTALIAAVYTQTLPGGCRGFTCGMGVTIAAAAQVVWESARRDEVLKFDFIRYGMAFAAVLLLLTLVLSMRRAGWKVGKWALYIGLFAFFALVCVAMEFFVDGKFIQNVPIWVCYLCDSLSACGLAVLCMNALRAACRKTA